MQIFTTGFPRSGSTFLNRLLGDLYSSPLQSTPQETRQWYGLHKGIEHNQHVIRKTHWREDEYTGNHYPNTEYGPVNKIVFIQRDPRDVAVSAMYYRKIQPNLYGVLQSMIEPRLGVEHPIYHLRGWYVKWLNGWLESGKADVYTTYEKLLSNTSAELYRIAFILTGDAFPSKWRDAVAKRQQFKNHASDFPHSMRKGIAGDWKNHFTRECGEYITEHLGQFMMEQKYIEDLEWWTDLKS